jgi:hypothetical protein
MQHLPYVVARSINSRHLPFLSWFLEYRRYTPINALLRATDLTPGPALTGPLGAEITLR